MKQTMWLVKVVGLTGVILALLVVIRVDNATVGTTLRCMGILRYFVMCLVISELITLPPLLLLWVSSNGEPSRAIAANLVEDGIRSVLYWQRFRKC